MVSNEELDCVDVEGRKLHVDDAVVFNQSGMLSRGKITKITKARSYVARNNPTQAHWQYIVQIGDAVVRNMQGIYKLDT